MVLGFSADKNQNQEHEKISEKILISTTYDHPPFAQIVKLLK